MVGFVSLVLASCPQHATAQVEPRAQLRLSSASASQEALRAMLVELAQTAGTTLEVTSARRIDLRSILATAAPEADGLLARAWLRTDPPEALLVLSDAAGDRLLLRRIPVGETLGPVEIESLAQIVASSLQALRLGGEIGVTRAELSREQASSAGPTTDPTPSPPATHAARAPPRVTPSRYFAEVEIGELASLWSIREGPEHRVSWRVSLGLQRTWHPALVLEAGYLVPSLVSRGNVGARLEGAALRAGLSLRRSLGRVSLRARVVGGADLLHVEPRLLAVASLSVRPAQWTALAMVEVAVGAGLRVLPRASVFCELGLGLDLANALYVVERPGDVETTFDPLRLRPFASLGLRIDLDSSREME